jgi:hypothetical protein
VYNGIQGARGCYAFVASWQQCCHNKSAGASCICHVSLARGAPAAPAHCCIYAADAGAVPVTINPNTAATANFKPWRTCSPSSCASCSSPGTSGMSAPYLAPGSQKTSQRRSSRSSRAATKHIVSIITGSSVAEPYARASNRAGCASSTSASCAAGRVWKKSTCTHQPHEQEGSIHQACACCRVYCFLHATASAIAHSPSGHFAVGSSQRMRSTHWKRGLSCAILCSSEGVSNVVLCTPCATAYLTSAQQCQQAES